MNPRRRRAADKEGERDGGGPKGNTRILGNVSKEAFLTCPKLSVSLSASMSPAGPARKTHTHKRRRGVFSWTPRRALS